MFLPAEPHLNNGELPSFIHALPGTGMLPDPGATNLQLHCEAVTFESV